MDTNAPAVDTDKGSTGTNSGSAVANNTADHHVTVADTKSGLHVVTTPVATAPVHHEAATTDAVLPTREAYKAQQAKQNANVTDVTDATDADTLPHTGDSTHEASLLAVLGLGLSTLAAGLIGKKRRN